MNLDKEDPKESLNRILRIANFQNAKGKSNIKKFKKIIDCKVNDSMNWQKIDLLSHKLNTFRKSFHYIPIGMRPYIIS